MRSLALGMALALLTGCATGGAPDVRPGELNAAALEDRLLSVGRAHLEARRYDEAARSFEELLVRAPERVDARHGLAEARLGMGDAVEALAMFEDLVEESPTDLDLREGQGLAHLVAGNRDRARELLEGVLAEEPERWRAWHALARIHDLDRAWSESDLAYANALNTAPSPARVHNNWGMSLLAREHHEAALEQFRKALEAQPGNTTARTNLEITYAFLERYDEALALSAEADLPRVLNNLGYVAMQQGNLQRAEAYFAQALDASPSFYAKVWRNLQQLERLKRSSVAS